MAFFLRLRSAPGMGLRARILSLLLLAGLGAALGLRTRVSTSLTDALPHDGQLGAAFADVERFSLLDTVWVEIDGSGQPPEALHAAIEALGQKLDAREEFATVRWRFGLEDGVALQAAAAPGLAVLLPEATLREKLSDAGLARSMLAWQQKLMGPAAALFASQIERDPLDLGGAFTEAAVRLGAGGGARLEQGHLVSADGSHGLLYARPTSPALGTSLSSPLVLHLQEDLAASPLPAVWLGSHRFAAEAQETIKTEVNRAVTAGLVGLALVFLLAFRSIRPLLGTLPATVVGALLAAAAAGLASPVHGIALAYGGALASLGVDYWIHLYVTGVGMGVPARFSDRLALGLRALGHLLPAYRISVAATVLSFLMLATSSYPVVADIGWIGVGVALGALASVVLAGPLVFAAAARPGDQLPRLPATSAHGRLAGLVVLALAALAAFAADVRFDGDPRALDARLPETAAIEDGFTRRYGGQSTTGLVVAEATSLDAALIELEKAMRALEGAPGLSPQGPGSLLPSSEAVARRKDLWADPTLEARFAAAAEAAGFDSAALLPGLRATAAATTVPDPSVWAGTPAGDLLARLVHDGERPAVAAVLPAETAEALAHAAHEVELSGAELRFVSPPAIAEEGAERIRAELLGRSGIALLAVLLYMALRYRDVPRFVAAAFPSLAAVAGTLGCLALSDLPLTPVSGPAFVLILGLAFDQGIFLVEAAEEDQAFRSARAGIVVALFTAFAGFAGLLSASHPAVWSVGAVVCLGIAWTAVGAFVVVPALLTPAGMLRTRAVVRALALLLTLGIGLDALASVLGRLEPPAWTEGEGRADWGRSHGIWVGSFSGSAGTIGANTRRVVGRMQDQNEASAEAEFHKHVRSRFVRYLLLRSTPFVAQRMVRDVLPAHLQEIAAISADPVDPLAWVAPRYTRKVSLHALHDLGQAMVDAPWVSGCTGFVAGGSRTDGRWLLARNWDFDGGMFFDEDKSVVAVAREGAIPYVHVAIPTLSGVVSGLNDAQIGVAVLAASSDAPIRLDTPMIFLVRQVLEEASSLADVERILDAGRGFVSEGILAVDGRRGEAAVFEVSPDDVHRIDAGEAMALSNHFRGRRAEDEMNRYRMAEGTTVARLARMEELLAEPGHIDLDRAVRMLRDRAGPGGKALPAGHESAINADNTSHSVILDATHKRLWVSAWPNVSGEYVSFSLPELLAGRLEGTVVAPPDDPARALRVHEVRALLREKGEDRATMERALALNPGDPDVLLALGRIAAREGDGATARRHLEALLATPPERAAQEREARAILEALP